MKYIILLVLVLLLQGKNLTNSDIEQKKLPLAKDVKYQQIESIISAYTLSADETDNTPNIGAGGRLDNVKFNVVACPRNINLGTWVEIDNIKYKCFDRMNIRYKNNFDILMNTKKEAFTFGRQIKLVKIYE